MLRFQGKRVLITGAARGIGQALAWRLAAEGSHLLVADLPASNPDETLRGVVAAGGSGSRIALDVSDTGSIAAARTAIHAEGGPIDVLVNNAGVVAGGPFLDVPLERHLHTFGVNTLGLVAVTHAFLPDLITRPAANLVNIASASGLMGLPRASSYAGSKWAVIGVSESLRLELRELGHGHVRVTTVCPSFADTGMFAGVGRPWFTPALTPEILAERIVRAMSAGRPFVRTPFMVKTILPLRGLLPTPAFDLVARVLGATGSMRGWRGHSAVQGGDDDPR